MLQIAHPQVIFNNTRLYHTVSCVEKESSPSAPVKNGIVILYKHSTEQLPPSLQTTAEKIVQACKFELSEAMFVNRSFQQVNLSFLQNSYAPKLIIAFGDLLLSKNLTPMKKNRAYEIGETSIIITETLENLESRKGEKTLLWNAIQSLLK